MAAAAPGGQAIAMAPASDLTALAALENARWCELVCAAHGAPGELHDACWLDRHPVPPCYPRLVTLGGPSRAPEHLEAVRALLDADPGRPLPVKDSFGALELAPLGFRRLLEADWILWPPGRAAPGASGPIRWRAVRDADGLAAWEEAWRGPAPAGALAGVRVFPAALLQAPRRALPRR